jgi:threonine dehydrogenase-like Zn-dependent dehydrogenase
VGENLLSEIEDITQGDKAEIAFDATGLKIPMEKGIQYLSAGGKYILVGLNKGDLAFNHPYIHAREISILCSRNATKADFASVIAEMSKGTFPSKAYITHKADFSQIPDHFDVWKDPANEVMKVVTVW